MSVQKAVALRYNHGTDSAPRVVAKGSGSVARRIIEIAEESGIPVAEDRTLLELLSAVEVSREIPYELYSAVAELLVFLFRIENGKISSDVKNPLKSGRDSAVNNGRTSSPERRIGHQDGRS